VAIIDRALATMAQRFGEIGGLPELQTVIQDTVTATVVSLNSIVRRHVDEMLQTSKLGVVEDMVQCLLTEEVLKMTTQTAQALSRKEVGEVSDNILRVSQQQVRSEEAWQRRFQLVASLEERHVQHEAKVSAHAQAVTKRLQEAERFLEDRIPKAEKFAAEAQGAVGALEKLTKKSVERLQDLEARMSKLEDQVAGSVARKQDLELVDSDLKDLFAKGEQAHSSQLLEALQPLRSVEELNRDRLESLEKSVCGNRSRLDAAVARAEGNTSRLDEQCARMEGQFIRKEDATRTSSEIAEKLRRMDIDLREYITKVKDSCADRVAIGAELVDIQEDREILGNEFGAARNDMQLHSDNLQNRFNQRDQALAQYREDVEQVIGTVVSESSRIGMLKQHHEMTRSEMASDRLRMDACINQQTHNRRDLTYVIAKVNMLDAFQKDLSEIRQNTEAMGQQARYNTSAVEQEATKAQQMQREASQHWQMELAGIQGSIDKLFSEQSMFNVSIQKLTSMWFQVAEDAERTSPKASPGAGASLGALTLPAR